MRGRIVWTIYRKELIESLRDRRTLFLMVVVPILLYPLLLIGMSKLMESQTEARGRAVGVVAELAAEPGPSRHARRRRIVLEIRHQPIEIGERRTVVRVVKVGKSQIDRPEDQFAAYSEALQHQGDAA